MHGVGARDFPFTREGYVIHRGRSTLSAVVERGETEHPLFDWAMEHHEPHFQGVEGARERYAALVAEFEDAGADGGPEAFLRACQSGTAG